MSRHDHDVKIQVFTSRRDAKRDVFTSSTSSVAEPPYWLSALGQRSSDHETRQGVFTLGDAQSFSRLTSKN